MNRLAQITTLAASIDTTLTQFAGLMPNAEGEYPWQAAQRQKRNRRVAAGAVGAAAIGAGVYGAKKGMGALNQRYGTTGSDGLKAGAADLVNRADDAMKGGMAKVKAGAQRVQSYGKNVAAKFKSLRSGASAGLGLGRRGALMGALKSVKFSRADHIIALERKLDGALAEFEMSDRERWAAGKFNPEEKKKLRDAAKKGEQIGAAVRPLVVRGAYAYSGYQVGKNRDRIVKGVKAAGSKAMKLLKR